MAPHSNIGNSALKRLDELREDGGVGSAGPDSGPSETSLDDRERALDQLEDFQNFLDDY